jgi:predicted DNA-binding transcriptional regulator AlpA
MRNRTSNPKGPAALASEKPGNEPMLTEPEAARFLKLSPRTLQHWRIRGEGPLFVSLGRAVRYSPRDLDAWLARRTRASTSQKVN